MDKTVRNILSKIESEGYEAYIVGGFVRDKILGKNTYDVDICTNALPKTLIEIFPLYQNANSYGGFNIKIKKYNIDITTYRKEIKYDNRRPVEVEYISSLFEDIKRRDFTINSLCMDKNDNIIDLLGAKKDIDSKIIKSIGNADQKFKEDPLRILRAIRFATVLDFNFDEDTIKAIYDNYLLVQLLSEQRIKEELTKILSSENYAKGLKLLKETKIDEVLLLNYTNIVYTKDILGMWAQVSCPKIRFSKTEEENIAKIKQIINLGKIESYELFNYGLYLCLVAGEVLGINPQVINKRFKSLPICSMKDIDINGKDIINLLGIEPGKIVSSIMSDVKNQILQGKLKNKKTDIKSYIVGKWHNE